MTTQASTATSRALRAVAKSKTIVSAHAQAELGGVHVDADQLHDLRALWRGLDSFAAELKARWGEPHDTDEPQWFRHVA